MSRRLVVHVILQPAFFVQICHPEHYVKGITNQYTVQDQLERTLNVEKLQTTPGMEHTEV